MRSRFVQFNTVSLVTLVCAGLSVSACAGRKVNQEGSEGETKPQPVAETLEEKDKKIEGLTAALSKAQGRIEEMDARLSALSDKVDATRLAVDNVSGGGRPIKTETVGSAAAEQHFAHEPLHEAVTEEEKTPRSKVVKGEEAKTLLRQDGTIADFTKSMSLFKAGKYADSEFAFNHFTETYPEHALAGSAQFYAGESYFMMGEYKLALNEYGKVVSTFSSSPRVASAMVRMAHCYEALGNTHEASRTYALARDLYADNPSLDWPSPSRSKTAVQSKVASKDLPSAPIEPAPAATSAPHSVAKPGVKAADSKAEITVPEKKNEVEIDDDHKIDDLNE